ncbi:hypothetical protein OSCI_1480039 [Kamptonema sp. PCC 6506]|nr:hypothetical protein OSCI_1480039 [Kamptonema sp. PCC 6506]
MLITVTWNVTTLKLCFIALNPYCLSNLSDTRGVVTPLSSVGCYTPIE